MKEVTVKEKLILFILLVVSVYVLLDSFTDVFSGYFIFRKAASVVIICLSALIFYLSLSLQKKITRRFFMTTNRDLVLSIITFKCT